MAANAHSFSLELQRWLFFALEGNNYVNMWRTIVPQYASVCNDLLGRLHQRWIRVNLVFNMGIP